MEQVLGASVLFTPHLAPMNRGILATCYARPVGAQTTESVLGCLSDAYADEPVVYERHRHRYEVNPALRPRLEEHGLIASGTSPDARLVEVIELADHPWFVASQFHPEFTSRPTRPQPLFREFVGAAAAHAVGERAHKAAARA